MHELPIARDLRTCAELHAAIEHALRREAPEPGLVSIGALLVGR